MNFFMADDGDWGERIWETAVTLETVKGYILFVEIIPYIICRKVLKLFNKNINGTKEVSQD